MTLASGTLTTAAAGCSYSTMGVPIQDLSPLDRGVDAMDAGPDLAQHDRSLPDQSPADAPVADRRR
jgi:hypothetical protein